MADIPRAQDQLFSGGQSARQKYSALVIHGDEETRAKHDALGFQDGWGKALEQLVSLAKSM